MPNLNDDLLPSINAIAEYVYGEANKKTVRRLRHLIDKHNFPVKQVGAKYEGRRSWCDQYYAEPDRRPGNGGDR
jgi:hypothetical protein